MGFYCMSFDDGKKTFLPVGVFDFHFHELVNTNENNSGT